MKLFYRNLLLVLSLGITTLAVSALAEDQTPVKPDLLTTCPVSGEKLGGDMGDPLVFTNNNQIVKLCCPHCKKTFDKNPKKYLAIIRAADKTAESGK